VGGGPTDRPAAVRYRARGGHFIVTGNHRVAPFPIAGHQPARHRGRGGLDAHAQDRHVFLHVVERLVDPVSVLTDRTVAA
jgi:hypothetical protein